MPGRFRIGEKLLGMGPRLLCRRIRSVVSISCIDQGKEDKEEKENKEGRQRLKPMVM
jgi:hypothetical protein